MEHHFTVPDSVHFRSVNPDGHVNVSAYIPEMIEQRPSILLALDGEDVFNRYREIIDRKVGHVVPLALFAIHVHGGRRERYVPSMQARTYLQWLEDTVLPEIERRYGFDTSRVGIVGESNGGLFAYYAAQELGTRFVRAACLSPALWWDNSEILSKPMGSGVNIYLSAGTIGGDISRSCAEFGVTQSILDTTIRAFDQLKDTGFDDGAVCLRILHGYDHNSFNWDRSFEQSLCFLYGPWQPALAPH